ncbi:hypothetical protein LCGC14_1696600 [marine sediment metagenome]|uniref:Uncharacterized protein n=1 Tax=marine sediment metagenome TaxID=412755 RepID=A0A0F9JZR0_9ZZZZ
MCNTLLQIVIRSVDLSGSEEAYIVVNKTDIIYIVYRDGHVVHIDLEPID